MTTASTNSSPLFARLTRSKKNGFTPKSLRVRLTGSLHRQNEKKIQDFTAEDVGVIMGSIITDTLEKAKTAMAGEAGAKVAQLEQDTRTVSKDDRITTDYGVRQGDTDNWLGVHTDDQTGPLLLEDSAAREKIHRFDHERIPERVVHARGAGAFGTFRLHKSAEDVTMAKVLTDTSRETPIFVRFSTVQGSRGSADTVRDVRGFAVKMYTQEGNWDIVGNNMPVFFIQDSIKFPDLIHSVKPEPQN